MFAFKGLLKKEWLIGKKMLYVLLFLQAAFFVIGYASSWYFRSSSVFTLMMFVMILFHMGGIPAFLCYLLSADGKSQLWLHNPNSSWLLLGAKLIMSLVFHFLSILAACFLAYVVLHFSEDIFRGAAKVIDEPALGDLLALAVTVTASSLFIGSIVLLLWTLYHSLARVRLVRKVRWLAAFLGFAAITVLWNWMTTFAFYKKMESIGSFHFHTAGKFEITAHSVSFSAAENSSSIMILALRVIFFVFAFWLSARLFDRKIEV
ncbi:hypothetical protein ACN6MY_19325 [Peribacillus sp. B-H-3]|uniref:hypothetical protein n=1 Tax=Peribacillus sp. B-H-3 TaxID=3400420 RepID=UPI003B02767A